MKKTDFYNLQGFTLIELMVVLVILSLVMMAVYSLYFTHQRTAYTQDEVVEVQQNLRIGMEAMTRDIRMAGFLIPYSSTPVASVNNNTGIAQPLPAPENINSDAITINTASASGAVTRVAQPPVGAVLTIDDPQGADLFTAGDIVTLVRPFNRIQPAGSGSSFIVSAASSSVPSITLTSAPVVPIIAGDLIVEIGPGGNYPNTITYCLGPSTLPAPNGCGNTVTTCPNGQLCLMRIVNGTAQTIAQNMAGLQISYLLDDGTETSAPSSLVLNTVRSVRVTLIGQTVATKHLSENVSKERRLESVIMMRDR